MKEEIDLSENDLKLLKKILQQHLPHNTKVWLFGSRVTGAAKPYSDIDLAIDLGKPASLDILAKLAAAFDESNLAYKVDIVDWAAVDESFRDKVAKDRVLLSGF